MSRSVRDMIAQCTGSSERIRVVPNGVDGSVFTQARPDARHDPNQILFVGFPNHNKGLDILFHAMRQLWQRRPLARLLLVGGTFYRHPRRQEEALRRLARELELGDRVRFLGPQPPHEVARLMRQSALLVLPSRAESFGAVLVEASLAARPFWRRAAGGPRTSSRMRSAFLFPWRTSPLSPREWTVS